MNWALFLFLIGANTFAQNVDLSRFVEKKQFVLAGTIDPPSVSLNGQQLETPVGQYKNLYVNGSVVPLTITGSLKSFYYSVESESLSLDFERNNGDKFNFLKLEFPSLNAVTTNGHELKWDFSPSVAKAKLDTGDISLESPTTRLDNIKRWVKQPHVLELISKNNLSQIYQLDFSPYQKELFRRYSFFYSLGEPSYNVIWDAPAAGLGASMHFEDDRYLDIVYYYSEANQIMDPNGAPRNITQKLYTLKSHYGYQVFQTNWNDFDFLRWTVGLQGEYSKYSRQSPSTDSFDGYIGTEVQDAIIIGGIFSRWEPIQYKNFGASLTIDFPVAATTGTSKIRTNAYFSINYYFK